MASNTGGYDQSSTRRPGTVTDQHGRKWSASIDNKSGYPVGVIRPKDWKAPWVPSQTYFKFTDRENPSQFKIDYDAILAERLEAHETWAAQYRKAALARGWNPEDTDKQNSVTELVGTKPLPIEPVVACVQGNKWMLGLSDKVDPRLVEFVRVRTDKVSRVVGSLDFSDPDDDFEDALDELEEIHDPEAVGGKKVKVKSAKRAA